MPAIDFGIPPSLVVIVIGVAVGGVVDEEMGHPVTHFVLVLNPTRLDGLFVAQVAIGEPNLDEGKIIGGFGIGVEDAELALAAKAGDGLATVSVAVTASILGCRESHAT